METQINTQGETKTKFYKDAVNYWAEIPATVDGMLGGYGHISQVDIQNSRHFLKQIFDSRNSPGKGRAIDCGAGIGRITKNLLTTIFTTVDLVEQNPAFLDKAKQYLVGTENRIGNYYAVGLQDFKPEKGLYDVIWAQWVLGHLTDQHLIDFFESCKSALKPNGIIVVKENVTSDGEIDIDEKDSSVTRPYKLFIELFEKAGLNCIRKQKQTHFPKELFSVYMFALKPKDK